LLSEVIVARMNDDVFDVVIPVPMHWRRRLARGSNHSRALAGLLAGNLDLPLGDDLVRTRYTPPQVNLPRTKRIEMVRGAFGLRSARAVEGARVLLVDDVTTTGATANESARTLLSGGASRVTLAVVAKAEPPTAYAGHWA
jgi:predicted amidophosphoribosyltransferase